MEKLCCVSGVLRGADDCTVTYIIEQNIINVCRTFNKHARGKNHAIIQLIKLVS